jgi:polyhydroxybutyrate depolymerase
MKNLLLFLFFCSCSTVQAQVNINFTFDGVARTAIVYLPSSYNASYKYPVVLVLHGLTQNGSGIRSYSQFDAVADTAKFIAVYPDGLSAAWNATIGTASPNDAGYLNALLDTVIAKYNVNTNRLYSCGFSNGGYMSHRLACEYANRFAAIASVSGTMFDATYSACNPTKAIPVLQIHGTADFVVSYNGSAASGKSVVDVMSFWVNKNACNTTGNTINLADVVNEGSTVSETTYSGCTNGTKTQLLKIQNGGHTWPSAVSISGIGNVNLDINGAREIWKFFNQFGAPLSTEDLTKNDFKVYPNPTTGIINLEGLNIKSVKLFSTDGRAVSVSCLNNKIDCSHLVSGVYYLLIEKDNGAIRRVVVNKE